MARRRWAEYVTPGPLLRAVGPAATERKLRLLGCACSRAMHDPTVSPNVWAALDVFERFTDGQATRDEMRAAWKLASVARDLAFGTRSWIPAHLQSVPAKSVAWAVYDLVTVATDQISLLLGVVDEVLGWLGDARPGRARAAAAEQAALVRDVFPDPSRPVTFDPSWRTTTVLALAAGAYADRAFDRLPILADALQDAGCEDADILDHCRGPGPHVRGCWVVDVVLSRA